MIRFITYLLLLILNIYLYKLNLKDICKFRNFIALILIFSVLFYKSSLILFVPTFISIFIKDYKELVINHEYNLILLITNIYILIFEANLTNVSSIIIKALIVFVIMYIFYCLGKIGGGDVLLAPNLIIFFNFEVILKFFLISCILSIVIYLIRKRISSDNFIPFGPPMIISFLIVNLI